MVSRRGPAARRIPSWLTFLAVQKPLAQGAKLLLMAATGRALRSVPVLVISLSSSRHPL